MSVAMHRLNENIIKVKLFISYLYSLLLQSAVQLVSQVGQCTSRYAPHVSDVVEIMKLNLKSQTTQFKHFLIYQIGACNRPSKVEVDNRAEPLKGISKYHSIWITEDGELRGTVLYCEDCTVK